MDEMRSFLAMGGYTAFVWPAFGLTALVLVGLPVAILRRLRAGERALAELRGDGQRRGATAKERRAPS